MQFSLGSMNDHFHLSPLFCSTFTQIAWSLSIMLHSSLVSLSNTANTAKEPLVTPLRRVVPKIIRGCCLKRRRRQRQRYFRLLTFTTACLSMDYMIGVSDAIPLTNLNFGRLLVVASFSQIACVRFLHYQRLSSIVHARDDRAGATRMSQLPSW